MYSISLGYVTVTTAGTPIPLSTILAALNLDPNLKVNKLEAWPLGTTAANMYVGLADIANGGTRTITVMNKGTGVGVLKQLLPPAATGRNDFFREEAPAGQVNTVRVADYAIDTDTSGSKLVLKASVA